MLETKHKSVVISTSLLLLNFHIIMQYDNVEAVSSRIENFNDQKLFDTIISRAYTDIQSFYMQTERLCSNGGCLLAMKGKKPEIAEIKASIKIIPLKIPYLQAARHLVKITFAADD